MTLLHEGSAETHADALAYRYVQDRSYDALRRFPVTSRIREYIGYGRALECGLTLVCFQYFLMMMAGELDWITDPHILALQDLEGVVPLWAQSLPFLLVAVVQAVGITLEAWGSVKCRLFRQLGGGGGMVIWMYVLVKGVLMGYLAAGINPWALMGVLGYMWIVRRGAPIGERG